MAKIIITVPDDIADDVQATIEDALEAEDYEVDAIGYEIKVTQKKEDEDEAEE